jgi:hypothetical protein
MNKFQGETYEGGVYFRPSTDGKIVHKITQEEYERRIALNPSDNIRKREWATPKASGVAYEEVYSALNGKIVAIKFREHEEYGRSIAVTLRQEGGAEGIFTCQTSNQYGTSLMERLPSVDFEREVRITAYVKEAESKKRYTTFITQGEDRVESHFKQWNDEDKKFDIKNGYPEVNEKEQKKFGSDYWTKRYYPEAEVFLIEYIEERVAPKVNNMVEVVRPVEQVNPEDIEF